MENKNIHLKILDFQNNVDVIKKDSKNPHFKNTYASLSAILSAVKPILNALKCTLTQPITNNEVLTIITDTESGESISSGIQMPTGLAPQNVGSAITYYRRYTLSSLLGLEIDDDDDGHLASEQQTLNDLPWLNKFSDKNKITLTENFNKVVEALKSGKFNLSDVEKKYKVSKDLKTELQNIK